ncbi:MAG TPA: AEC family transporter [Pseudomonadota bacterium]|nr:AEC family transporter [Pseudomonadota bacterium]
MISAILSKILISLCLIFVGWLGARRLARSIEAARLSAVVGVLGRLVLEVSLPALAFTAIVRTTAPGSQRAAWLIPLLGFGLCAVAALVGTAVARVTARPALRRTLTFVIGVPNWIYLPLPIAAGLYGEIGTRTVLLCNVGALIWLWTFGVYILSGRSSLGAALRAVGARPGLWATLAGVAVGLGFPGAHHHAGAVSLASQPAAFVWTVLFQSLELLGTLTTPLALLVTGAQLAELRDKARPRGREFAAALIGRLLLAPLCTFAILHLFPDLLAPGERATVALIAAMPVAVSCTLFTRELGGDDGLAATSIVWSTAAALLTVPLLLALWPQ